MLAGDESEQEVRPLSRQPVDTTGVLRYSGSSWFRLRILLSTLSGRPLRIDSIRLEADDPGIKGASDARFAWYECKNGLVVRHGACESFALTAPVQSTKRRFCD